MTRPPLTCAAPTCHQPMPKPQGRGRPPIYCSPECRPSPHTRRPGPVVVEIDHAPTSGGRPAGQIWHVTLRRDQHHTTIADGLGRFQAEDLAQRIAQILDTNHIARPQHDHARTTRS